MVVLIWNYIASHDLTFDWITLEFCGGKMNALQDFADF
jgi:hypothetical protein